MTAASLAHERDSLVQLARLCTANANPDGAAAARVDLAALIERAGRHGFIVSPYYGVQVVRMHPDPPARRAPRPRSAPAPRPTAAESDRAWQRIDSLDEVWGITPRRR